MKKVAAVLFAISLATQAALASVSGSTSIAPPNNHRIPVRPRSAGDFSPDVVQDSFDKIIAKMQALYAPVFVNLGQTLDIQNMWTDDTENSDTTMEGKTAVVHVYGGLARDPLMTDDGELLVICHEIGHHLGGAPKNPGLFGLFKSWSTDEGGADYFATLKCARHAWASDDNGAALAGATIPQTVVNGCQKSFTQSVDIQICERTALGSMSLALTLSHLDSDTTPPSFDTPDPSVVAKTFNEHPAAQCRLDTYFAGAICQADKDVAQSATDATVGSCNGDQAGARPLCWYKPKQ